MDELLEELDAKTETEDITQDDDVDDVYVTDHPAVVVKKSARQSYPCDACDAYFHTDTNLTMHKAFIHRERHSCDVCDVESADVAALLQHIKACHRELRNGE